MLLPFALTLEAYYLFLRTSLIINSSTTILLHQIFCLVLLSKHHDMFHIHSTLWPSFNSKLFFCYLVSYTQRRLSPRSIFVWIKKGIPFVWSSAWQKGGWIQPTHPPGQVPCAAHNSSLMSCPHSRSPLLCHYSL